MCKEERLQRPPLTRLLYLKQCLCVCVEKTKVSGLKRKELVEGHTRGPRCVCLWAPQRRSSSHTRSFTPTCRQKSKIKGRFDVYCHDSGLLPSTSHSDNEMMSLWKKHGERVYFRGSECVVNVAASCSRAQRN